MGVKIRHKCAIWQFLIHVSLIFSLEFRSFFPVYGAFTGSNQSADRRLAPFGSKSRITSNPTTVAESTYPTRSFKRTTTSSHRQIGSSSPEGSENVEMNTSDKTTVPASSSKLDVKIRVKAPKTDHKTPWLYPSAKDSDTSTGFTSDRPTLSSSSMVVHASSLLEIQGTDTKTSMSPHPLTDSRSENMMHFSDKTTTLVPPLEFKASNTTNVPDIDSESPTNLHRESDFDTSPQISDRSNGDVKANLPYLLMLESESTSFLESSTVTRPPWRTFSWNKRELGARDYQRSYCSSRCNGSELTTLFDLGGCPELECFPCRCERPMCEIYGICCPNLLESSSQVKISPDFSDDNFSSSSAQSTTGAGEVNPDQLFGRTEYFHMKSVCINYKNISEFDTGRLLARSCPSNYNDDRTRAMCEKDTPIKQLTTSIFIHVSDNATGIQYFNEHCASCNGATQPIPWAMSVECKHLTHVYQALNYDEFLRLSLDQHSSCRVAQEPSESLDEGNYHPCHMKWFQESTGRCNVTGKWLKHDEDVRRACEEDYMVYGITDQVKHYSMHYRNIFCAICNMASYPIYDQSICPNYGLGSGYYPFLRLPLPFSFLINFESLRDSGKIPLSDEWDGVYDCSSDNEWLSPDGRCLPLHCSRGKILNSGNCTTSVSEIRGLTYKLRCMYHLHHFLEPVSSQGDSQIISASWSVSDYLTAFEYKMKRILEPVSSAQMELRFVILHYSRPRAGNTGQAEIRLKPERSYDEIKDNFQSKLWFTLDANIMASKALNRDEFESYAIKELVATNVTVTMPGNVSLIFTPQLVTKEQGFPLKCDLSEDDDNACFGTVVFVSPPYTSPLLDVWKEEAMLTLASNIVCPFISFNQSEYVLESNDTARPPTRMVTLDFNLTKFTFKEVHELNKLSIEDDGTLKVCKDLLEAKAQDYYNNVRERYDPVMHWWLYVLSMICIGASVICLALSLLTYFLFQTLRTTAGNNNICLCGSLLLAQIFLVVSSQVQKTGPMCTVLGITTHFLWLSMFCWCGACCFHMFHVFTAKTRSLRISKRAERIHLLQRAIICSTLPSTVVIAVILASYFTSDRQRIGYGDTNCYLDSTLLIITSLIVPLSIILMCNFVFFFISVLRIHNVRKLQTHADFKESDRVSLYIYVKLSTLTGGFWAIQIISEALGSDPLRFIAVILNGLQGVFIFFSYICNKRVFIMYAIALGLVEHASVTTPTTRSTPGTVASDEVRKAEAASEEVKKAGVVSEEAREPEKSEA